MERVVLPGDHLVRLCHVTGGRVLQVEDVVDVVELDGEKRPCHHRLPAGSDIKRDLRPLPLLRDHEGIDLGKDVHDIALVDRDALDLGRESVVLRDGPHRLRDRPGPPGERCLDGDADGVGTVLRLPDDRVVGVYERPRRPPEQAHVDPFRRQFSHRPEQSVPRRSSRQTTHARWCAPARGCRGPPGR